MNKKVIGGLLILLAISIGTVVFFSMTKNPPHSSIVGAPPAITSVCFQKNCFQVELATTEQQQETGLMNRTSLAQNAGMLFIFGSQDIYGFWMKNTLIPLDMIWMDANKKVVFMEQNAAPCKQLNCPIFIPPAKASYVLEINGGLTQEDGIIVGSQATFQ